MAQFDLEYFFDLLPDLLFIAGYDGYLKKINPAVSNTLGYSLEELLGTHIDTLVHPEDKELTARKREQLRKGETLFQFENRYLRKDGTMVWLLWTAVPIMRDQIIFAIAKDITSQKSSEQQETLAALLDKLNTEQMKRFSADLDLAQSALISDRTHPKWLDSTSAISQTDQLWLKRFETVVRHYAGKSEINLKILSSDMAVSERQLFRQVKRIMSITPNQLVRMIRLHLAWEAIASRKYRTLSEISRIAGYNSNTYFKKLFSQVYGIEASELL